MCGHGPNSPLSPSPSLPLSLSLSISLLCYDPPVPSPPPSLTILRSKVRECKSPVHPIHQSPPPSLSALLIGWDLGALPSFRVAERASNRAERVWRGDGPDTVHTQTQTKEPAASRAPSQQQSTTHVNSAPALRFTYRTVA